VQTNTRVVAISHFLCLWFTTSYNGLHKFEIDIVTMNVYGWHCNDSIESMHCLAIFTVCNFAFAI